VPLAFPFASEPHAIDAGRGAALACRGLARQTFAAELRALFSRSSESDISGPMQPLPLNQRLDRIGQHIVRARLFLDLWFYFEEQDSRRKIIDTMEEYNEFFRFTPHAYLVAYVIYMAGVFDKTTDTISFPHLVPEMKREGQLKDQDAKDVDALLVEAKPVVSKILILRHKALAHRSAHISYDDVFKMAAVRPDQLRDLTDVALKIANRLLIARGLQDQHFTELPREAAEAMMKALGEKLSPSSSMKFGGRLG
jgi:hypothetical protein